MHRFFSASSIGMLLSCETGHSVEQGVKGSKPHGAPPVMISSNCRAPGIPKYESPKSTRTGIGPLRGSKPLRKRAPDQAESSSAHAFREYCNWDGLA